MLHWDSSKWVIKLFLISGFARGKNGRMDRTSRIRKPHASRKWEKPIDRPILKPAVATRVQTIRKSEKNGYEKSLLSMEGTN